MINKIYKTKKLPPVNLPEQYSKETDSVYKERCYRWRVWLDMEPRPAFWYATEQEIQLYRKWRDTEPILHI